MVLDPYATTVLSRRRYGELAKPLAYGSPGVLGLAPTWPQAAAGLPQPPGRAAPFDWQGDAPLNLPAEDLIVYEAHVRGFTASPSRYCTTVFLLLLCLFLRLLNC